MNTSINEKKKRGRKPSLTHKIGDVIHGRKIVAEFNKGDYSYFKVCCELCGAITCPTKGNFVQRIVRKQMPCFCSKSKYADKYECMFAIRANKHGKDVPYEEFKKQHYSTWKDLYDRGLRIYFHSGKFQNQMEVDFDYTVNGITYTRRDIEKLLDVSRQRVSQIHMKGEIYNRLNGALAKKAKRDARKAAK